MNLDEQWLSDPIALDPDPPISAFPQADIDRLRSDATWAGASGRPRITGVFKPCLERVWLDAYDAAPSNPNLRAEHGGL